MRRWDNLLTRVDKDAHVLNDPRMMMLNEVEKAERDSLSIAYILALLSFPTSGVFETTIPFYTAHGIEVLAKAVEGVQVPTYTEVTITPNVCKVLKTDRRNLFTEVQLIIQPNKD